MNSALGQGDVHGLTISGAWGQNPRGQGGRNVSNLGYGCVHGPLAEGEGAQPAFGVGVLI